MENRVQLHRALSARAWPDVFDLAARLVERADEGEPRGGHAHWASVAAGRLGRWYDAVFYARHASEVAGQGTDFEATALCNLTYFYVQYGAPESALATGNTYLRRLDLYSEKSRTLAPRILQHLAAARELLSQWHEAATLYREAAVIATIPAIRALALIDCAYSELKQGTHRVSAAEEALAQLNHTDLDPDGRFAFYVVQAHFLHIKDDFTGSDQAAGLAIDAAQAVEEPLERELAMVKLVQARNAFARFQRDAGTEDRTRAIKLGFEAALTFQQQNQVALYHESRQFLCTVLDID